MKYAKGGVVTQPTLSKYKKGGVVTQPTVTKYAKGGVVTETEITKYSSKSSSNFDKESLTKYAKGGVVTEPTFFRYGAAGNLGLMGEAGAEAILPLKRGRSGNLGVEASGGGSTNIVVNVDASGSSVEGNEGQANAFGIALGAAIQAELIAQKRAGGLLSNA